MEWWQRLQGVKTNVEQPVILFICLCGHFPDVYIEKNKCSFVSLFQSSFAKVIAKLKDADKLCSISTRLLISMFICIEKKTNGRNIFFLTENIDDI